ncbi:MAG: hypothetical protein ACK4M7_03640 [Burkholderiales bacterium]
MQFTKCNNTAQSASKNPTNEIQAPAKEKEEAQEIELMIKSAREKQLNQLATILEKIQQGTDVKDIINQFDPNDVKQHTALHQAVKLRDTALIKLLIKHGADTEVKSSKNSTPFI